jgi:putative transposase
MNHERKTIRLQNWDYSSEGIYYITICCLDRKSFFGEVRDHAMILSEIGSTASQYWLEIPNHFPHVKLDEFVVMPNHLHGLLILDYSFVGTRHGVVLLQSDKNTYQKVSQFSKPKKNSVSVIINQYKSSVKRWCNRNGYKYFQWQARFYDQIVRDEISIENIREYVYNNPKNWDTDDLFNL